MGALSFRPLSKDKRAEKVPCLKRTWSSEPPAVYLWPRRAQISTATQVNICFQQCEQQLIPGTSRMSVRWTIIYPETMEVCDRVGKTRSRPLRRSQ